MSSESQPRLGAAVPMFEMLMSSWEKLARDEPRLKPWVDHALNWVYKYYKRMDNKDVYILAMCKFLTFNFTNTTLSYFETVVDPATRLAWIKYAWDAEFVMKAEELILKTVCLRTLLCMSL